MPACTGKRDGERTDRGGLADHDQDPTRGGSCRTTPAAAPAYWEAARRAAAYRAGPERRRGGRSCLRRYEETDPECGGRVPISGPSTPPALRQHPRDHACDRGKSYTGPGDRAIPGRRRKKSNGRWVGGWRSRRVWPSGPEGWQRCWSLEVRHEVAREEWVRRMEAGSKCPRRSSLATIQVSGLRGSMVGWT
jgi:hypothetical protein